ETHPQAALRLECHKGRAGKQRSHSLYRFRRTESAAHAPSRCDATAGTAAACDRQPGSRSRYLLVHGHRARGATSRDFDARGSCASANRSGLYAGGRAQASHRNCRQAERTVEAQDRKSTRLNSSHVSISYAVFCLKKKKKKQKK